MKKFLLGFFFGVLFMGHTKAQSVILSGTVRDSLTHESMPSANVFLEESRTGATCDNAGRFRIRTDTGSYTLICSFVGYRTQRIPVHLTGNRQITIQLAPVITEQSEFTIYDNRENINNIEKNQMGRTLLHVQAIRNAPALFGETDVIKSIQLLPGIQSSGEGNSGFHVRGGGLDQNLILLDHGSIYNAGHLFGFFSVFNTDAVQTAEMMKGDIPAAYGGRLSSVLQVTTPSGDMRRFKGKAGIGLIFSNISLEGPIVREKASFLFTARRTYIDAVIQPFLSPTSSLRGLKFFFYDLNGKLSWKIKDKDQLHLSLYHGSDTYGFRSGEGALDALFSWSNSTASLQWWHFFNADREMFLHAGLSDYNFDTRMHMEIYEMLISSGIRDYTARWELSDRTLKNNNFRFGWEYTFHQFNPNHYEAMSGSMPMDLQDRETLFAHEAALYASDNVDISKKIKLNMGLRASYFQQIGPHTAYLLNEIGQVIDSVFYTAGSKVKDYAGLEPRLSMRVTIDSTKSVKASYNHNYQYVQQVTLSCISLPTDAWIPSTADVLPQSCDQVAVGWFQNFLNHQLTTSLEAYYKFMRNLTEYREGFSPFTEAAYGYSQPYTQGNGWSYGVECFVQKESGRLTGWLSYTLSWSFRQFNEINNGEVFCAKNDRRHDISLLLSYDILPNLTASAVWVYATGNTMTVPIGYYFIGHNLVVEYSKTNAYRMPPYHRLDLSIQWVFRRSEKWEQSLNFSVYNAYNRKNPFFINIYTSMQNSDLSQLSLQSTAYQMSLFPILPSISWNIRFK